MNTYRVTWKIDIEADSPQEAARQALAIQRDPASIATVFDVEPTPTSLVDMALGLNVVTIDLSPGQG